MGSFRRGHFDPLDLEIIDCVYEAAWVQLQARYPNHDTAEDSECQDALRKRIFAVAMPANSTSIRSTIRSWQTTSGDNGLETEVCNNRPGWLRA